jgi:hypothetical protein
MGSWLWGAWLQVWPNLAANVLWVPVVGIHHLAMKRHLARLHAQQRQHIETLIDRTEKP